MGRWKYPRKYEKVTIAVARARWNELEGDPSLSTKPNRSHRDRLRKPCKRESWKQVVWKRHGGSWVSHIPSQKIYMENENWSRYVKGTSPFDIWYHCDFWPSSLAQEPESHLCPLLDTECNYRKPKRHQLEVLHLFRCSHTHTHVMLRSGDLLLHLRTRTHVMLSHATLSELSLWCERCDLSFWLVPGLL